MQVMENDTNRLETNRAQALQALMIEDEVVDPMNVIELFARFSEFPFVSVHL